MRQPGSSSHRRYADYGHMPHTGSSRGSHTPTSNSRTNPDVVIENIDRTTSRDHHDRNHYTTAMNSIHHNSMGGGDSSGSPSNKLGTASNPNRAEIPPGRRKGSYDPVSYLIVLTIITVTHRSIG